MVGSPSNAAIAFVYIICLKISLIENKFFRISGWRSWRGTRLWAPPCTTSAGSLRTSSLLVDTSRWCSALAYWTLCLNTLIAVRIYGLFWTIFTLSLMSPLFPPENQLHDGERGEGAGGQDRGEDDDPMGYLRWGGRQASLLCLSICLSLNAVYLSVWLSFIVWYFFHVFFQLSLFSSLSFEILFTFFLCFAL